MSKPLYPSKDFEEFCAHQKQKGLKREFWKDLSKMWEEELDFRKEFEDALNKFASITQKKL